MPRNFDVKLSMTLDLAKTLTSLQNIKDGGTRLAMENAIRKVCRDVRDLARNEDFHKYKDRTGALTRAIKYRAKRKGDIVTGKVFVDILKAPHAKFVINGFKGFSRRPYTITVSGTKRLNMLKRTKKYKNASSFEKSRLERSAIGPSKRIMAFYTTPFPTSDGGLKNHLSRRGQTLQWKNKAPRPPTAIEQKWGETKWVKTTYVEHPGYKGDDFLGRAAEKLDAELYFWEEIDSELKRIFGAGKGVF